MAEMGRADTVDATKQGPSDATSMAMVDTAASTPISKLISKNSRLDYEANRFDDQPLFDYTAIYADVFIIRDDVREHVNRCHERLNLPAAGTVENSDWNEVDASVKEACDDIQRLASEREAKTGAAGNLRRAFRFLCKHAGAGETFVSVIPTDQFGFASVLCGGLKAVFSALKHTHEYREKVYLALEDLPFIICDHSVPLDQHINDEELHRRAAGLHIAVFKVIKRILRWWLSGSFVLALKSIANPSRLLSDLNEDLAEVKVRASRFERRALNITQSLQRQSFQLQYLAALDSERKALEVQDLRRDIKSLKEMICRANSLDRLESAPNAIATSPVNESSQLSGKSYNLDERRQESNVAILLANFFFERDLVPDDCQALMKLMSPNGSSVADHARILAIESSFRIQAWLIIDESSLLLIDGRAESRRDMEVSVFVARIVHRLRCWQHEVIEVDEDTPIIICLAFFCSQHRDRHDAQSNPTEMAMSLLLQLIDQYRAGLSSSLLQSIRTTLDPRSMSSICLILGDLIMKLQRNVVLVLVIEGLVHFTQDEAQRGGTRELIAFLIATYRKRTRATLKFLFSSPTRPDFVEDLFREKELLHLPRSVASAHSPNNMLWKKPVEFRSRAGRDTKYP